MNVTIPSKGVESVRNYRINGRLLTTGPVAGNGKQFQASLNFDVALPKEVADIDEDLVFLSIVTSLIAWGLYAFLEYCAYHVLSLLIASLATIVQNTRITANVALYNVAKEEGTLNEETAKSTLSANNQSSGYSLSKLANERTNNSGSWICKECGTKNERSNLYCKDCGKYK